MADKIRKSKYTVAEIDAAVDMLLEGYTRDEIDARLSEIEARLDALESTNEGGDT